MYFGDLLLVALMATYSTSERYIRALHQKFKGWTAYVLISSEEICVACWLPPNGCVNSVSGNILAIPKELLWIPWLHISLSKHPVLTPCNIKQVHRRHLNMNNMKHDSNYVLQTHFEPFQHKMQLTFQM